MAEICTKSTAFPRRFTRESPRTVRVAFVSASVALSASPLRSQGAASIPARQDPCYLRRCQPNIALHFVLEQISLTSPSHHGSVSTFRFERGPDADHNCDLGTPRSRKLVSNHITRALTTTDWTYRPQAKVSPAHTLFSYPPI
jgi:hypothetical protein